MNNKNDRHDGNHTQIGRSYTMVVPTNISSHREAGNLTVKTTNDEEKGERDPLSEREKEADHKTTYNKTITTSNAR